MRSVRRGDRGARARDLDGKTTRAGTRPPRSMPALPRRDGAALACSRLVARGGARCGAATRFRGEAHGTALGGPYGPATRAQAVVCAAIPACAGMPIGAGRRRRRCRHRVARTRRSSAARRSIRVRHRARRTCRDGVARRCRSQHRQGDGVLGRDRLAVHEPRRRVMVRQSDLSGAPGRGEDGAARHLLARQRLRSLGSHPRAGDWAYPVRFGVE
jgi:hypothetical protein